MADTPASIACEDGVKLAFHHNPGYTPGVIFCTGFRSDMTGGKAVSLGAFSVSYTHLTLPTICSV